jgi:tRNA-binding protein
MDELKRDQLDHIKSQISFDDFEKLDMRVAEVLSAKEAQGARKPSRVFELDLGSFGTRQAVGQYMLVPEEDLVGKKVVVCCNLGTRKMGRYKSEVLVMGVPHPDSPEDQNQALPITVPIRAKNGDRIF